MKRIAMLAVIFVFIVCSCSKGTAAVEHHEKSSSASDTISSIAPEPEILDKQPDSSSVENVIDVDDDAAQQPAEEPQPKSSVKIYDPPLSIPMSKSNEGDWMECIATEYFNSLYPNGIYWIDDNKSVRFVGEHFVCVDLETNDFKILLDLGYMCEPDSRFMKFAHNEVLRSYAPMLFSSGFCFNEDKSQFTVPTITDNWATYTFSCEDLSFVSSDPNLYFLNTKDDRGNNIYGRDFVTSDGKIFESNIEPAPTWIRSYTDPSKPANQFETTESDEYALLNVSPSGKYLMFLNLSKSELGNRSYQHGIVYDPEEPPICADIYIEIFDNNGKFISKIQIEDWCGVPTFITSHFRFLSPQYLEDYDKFSRTPYLLGGERICIEDKFYYIDGTPVESDEGYFLVGGWGEMYSLLFRDSHGNEKVIKENIMPGYAREISFNPSLTACTWEEQRTNPNGRGWNMYIGYNQWELP